MGTFFNTSLICLITSSCGVPLGEPDLLLISFVEKLIKLPSASHVSMTVFLFLKSPWTVPSIITWIGPDCAVWTGGVITFAGAEAKRLSCFFLLVSQPLFAEALRFIFSSSSTKSGFKKSSVSVISTEAVSYAFYNFFIF